MKPEKTENNIEKTIGVIEMNVYFFKEELLKEFKVFLESMERSKATVEKYMRDVGAFARKYPQIDKETVRVIRRRLLRTINRPV